MTKSPVTHHSEEAYDQESDRPRNVGETPACKGLAVATGDVISQPAEVVLPAVSRRGGGGTPASRAGTTKFDFSGPPAGGPEKTSGDQAISYVPRTTLFVGSRRFGSMV
jgi:hypothetical protein